MLSRRFLSILTLLAASTEITFAQLERRQINGDVCLVSEFMWDTSRGQYCCPGVVDNISSDGYCCVGAHVPQNAVWTTTQTSCATKIPLTESDYSSMVREAATKYSVTFTSTEVFGNQTSYSVVTVGAASPTTGTRTGGAAAALMTSGPIAGAAVMIAGGLIMAT